jgi:membrane protease YdiL (CAAX protease family)
MRQAGWPQPVPWTAGEILFALFLVLYVWPPAAYGVLRFTTPVLQRYYGPELTALAEADEAAQRQQAADLGLVAGPGAADLVLPAARQQALYRRSLWLSALAFPLRAATVPLVLLLSGTRPRQLGLTTRRLGWNVLWGVVGAAVLAPLVLGLNELVLYLYTLGLPGAPEEHPFTLLIRSGNLWPAEWGLLFAEAVIAAPFLEELLFRGLLQPWFATRRWGGHAAVAAALAIALAARWDRLRELPPPGPFLEAAAPALFVLALVPVYALVVYRSRSPVAPALFGTALLFAAVHSTIWPTPVALFVLGLGLGALAYRTQSLAGPVVLHGLFNAVSFVLLV